MISMLSGDGSNLTAALKKISENESDNGLADAPDWESEIIPFIDQKFADVFIEYQAMISQNKKEILADFNKNLDDFRTEIECKFKQVEQNSQFIQNEVHHLVGFQAMLQEIGMINEKGEVNENYASKIQETKEKVNKMHEFNMIQTCYQTESMKIMEDIHNQIRAQ